MQRPGVHRLRAYRPPRRVHGARRLSESFEFYGEERDYCLRQIDAGYRTVYLPDYLVIHEPDPSGRSRQRYLRYVRETTASPRCTTSPSTGWCGCFRHVWRCTSGCAAPGTSPIRGAGRGYSGSSRNPRFVSAIEVRVTQDVATWKRLRNPQPYQPPTRHALNLNLNLEFEPPVIREASDFDLPFLRRRQQSPPRARDGRAGAGRGR